MGTGARTRRGSGIAAWTGQLMEARMHRKKNSSRWGPGRSTRPSGGSPPRARESAPPRGSGSSAMYGHGPRIYSVQRTAHDPRSLSPVRSSALSLFSAPHPSTRPRPPSRKSGPSTRPIAQARPRPVHPRVPRTTHRRARACAGAGTCWRWRSGGRQCRAGSAGARPAESRCPVWRRARAGSCGMISG